MTSILASTILGIDWIKILMHLLVFAVLMTGLTLLLYKPVLKFVKARQDNIQKGLDDGKRMQEEAQAVKAEYEDKLAKTELEIEERQQNAAAELEAYKAEQKELVDQEIAALRSKAQEDIQQEREHAVKEIHDEVVDIAIKLTGELLEKEISKEDNSKLIEECLKEWGKDHD